MFFRDAPAPALTVKELQSADLMCRAQAVRVDELKPGPDDCRREQEE